MSVWLLDDPPAPSGINDFPNAPEPVTKKWPIEGEVIERHEVGLSITINNRVLIVVAQWHLVVGVTATAATPNKRTVRVTKGTVITDSTATTVAANLGVKSDLVSIGASVSTVTSHSEQYSEQQTEEETFTLTPPDSEPISAIWWQPQYTYSLEANQKSVKIDGGVTIPKYNKPVPTQMWTNYEPEYLLKTFPPLKA